jgi:hypothetical protein
VAKKLAEPLLRFDCRADFRLDEGFVMSSRKKMNGKKVQKKVQQEGEKEFEQLQSERDALKLEELVRPNVDVGRAVGMVLVSEPKIAALRRAMERELPEFDAGVVDRLRPVALAAGYANVVFGPSPEETANKRLIAEATKLRVRLVRQAKALVEVELIEAAVVDKIRHIRTHRGLANNLIALSHLFRKEWDEIENVTVVSDEEVRRAGKLGMSLLEQLGSKDVASAAESEASRAAEIRVRAYTLLAKTYDEVRRAVIYMRWRYGDADEIAPSFHVRVRRRPGAQPAAPAVPAAPASPIS